VVEKADPLGGLDSRVLRVREGESREVEHRQRNVPHPFLGKETEGGRPSAARQASGAPGAFLHKNDHPIVGVEGARERKGCWKINLGDFALVAEENGDIVQKKPSLETGSPRGRT